MCDRREKKNVRDLAVLIPVFNRQVLLQNTLESLRENFPFDIIVVDDGSLPPIVLPNLPHKGETVLIRLEMNSGITSALNTGLSYILNHGYNYVARIDAGDLAKPKRLATQIDFLQKNPAYGLVGTRVELMTNGEVLLDDLPSTVLKRKLHLYNPIAHPSVMLTRQAIIDTGFYDYRSLACEDWDYWFRVSKKYEIANLKEPLTILDDSTGSICRDTDRAFRLKRRWNMLKILLRHFDPMIWESYLGILKMVLILLVNLIIPSKIITSRNRISSWFRTNSQ